MKIVVLDGYTENPGDISWAPLEALGEVTVYDRTAYEESPLIARDVSAMQRYRCYQQNPDQQRDHRQMPEHQSHRSSGNRLQRSRL